MSGLKATKSNWKTCMVKKAVASIKSHDDYVLKNKGADAAEKNGISRA